MAAGSQGRHEATTYVPPPGAELAPILARNISALQQRTEKERRTASWQERTADAITRFTGSMTFVFIHLTVFGIWIIANLGWIPRIPAWDESFVVLAMIASVEAIFLSTFVLISQNRMAALAEKRADLDLQVSLLSEHELTKLAALLSDIAQHLGVETQVQEELEDVKRNISPEAVLDRIEAER